MEQPNVIDTVVFESGSRRACMESRLVLDSAGIASHVVRQGGLWQLVVAGRDGEVAVSELSSYLQERQSEKQPVVSTVTKYGGATWGVVGYVTVLVVIGAASLSESSRPVWQAIGRMNAGQVMAGQLHRAATALTLHADIGHLLSNLVFGGVFGWLAGRILGGGVAWLTITSAGVFGNLLNAAMRPAEHNSIGASTAVFAALGVMVAHALRPRTMTNQNAMQRYSPLIGGVLMLAMMGLEGDRTDVGAHITGFLAGLLMGAAAARLPEVWLRSRWFQASAGAIAIGIVVAAWAIAIATAKVSSGASPS
ncbi:Rhomboid family protein [Rubripirellula lacrimiformis]|uniref:Rhomboid family protein n=1 Tax=Rubripirellula lacrimiformis TaxID=1930273 RepID=A0A517NEC4_9BACT|nr:rhomboid family intramembrane serine protease [Rubripirellula lacrimiformis]QDT05486.1 Rhomboid family protein [Rubripirellula lacrimiformis]